MAKVANPLSEVQTGKILQKRTVKVSPLRNTAPFDIRTLVLTTDIILVGRVQKVLAVRPLPIGISPNHPDWLSNQTIYAVSVERYFKGSGPHTIKLMQPGGEVEGVTYIEDDFPQPTVGERYLLFLNDTGKTVRSRSLGYQAVYVGNKMYKGGELDELVTFSPRVSRIWLDEGITRVIPNPNDPQPADRRMDSQKPETLEIIGVTEQEAIDLVMEYASGVHDPKFPHF